MRKGITMGYIGVDLKDPQELSEEQKSSLDLLHHQGIALVNNQEFLFYLANAYTIDNYHSVTSCLAAFDSITLELHINAIVGNIEKFHKIHAQYLDFKNKYENQIEQLQEICKKVSSEKKKETLN